MKAFRMVILSLILAGCGAKAPTKAPVKAYYPGMVSANPVIKPVDGFQVITVTGGKGTGSVDGISTDARFNAPEGVLAVDNQLFVADTGNYLIRCVASDGSVKTLAGSTLGNVDGQGAQAKFMGPSDLARDPQGNILVADFNHIRKVTPAGEVTTLALHDGSGNPVKYVEIFGILCNSQGQIFVSTLHRIDRIAPDGQVTTLAGNGDPGYRDGQGSNASFNLPRKMAFEGDRIAIADFGNLRIREVTMAGVVTTKTLAGTGDLGYVDGTANTALMNFPIGVAWDGTNLYVADTYNQAIRMVSPDGRLSTLAGNNTYGYQDGNGILANFAQPSDIDVTGSRVYVADTGNNAIRLIQRAQ